MRLSSRTLRGVLVLSLTFKALCAFDKKASERQWLSLSRAHFPRAEASAACRMRTNINKCCIPLKTLIHDNVLFEVTRPTWRDVFEEAACDLVSSYKTFFFSSPAMRQNKLKGLFLSSSFIMQVGYLWISVSLWNNSKKILKTVNNFHFSWILLYMLVLFPFENYH